LADCGSENILKRLVGRTDVEDALSRLDTLTKEESLMMVVRNLEVTHRVDGVVHEIDSNVKSNMVVTEDIDNNVKETKLLVEDLEDSMKEIEGVARSVDNGTQNLLSASVRILVSHCIST
jgi:uncharacterized membrane protein